MVSFFILMKNCCFVRRFIYHSRKIIYVNFISTAISDTFLFHFIFCSVLLRLIFTAYVHVFRVCLVADDGCSSNSNSGDDDGDSGVDVSCVCVCVFYVWLPSVFVPLLLLLSLQFNFRYTHILFPCLLYLFMCVCAYCLVFNTILFHQQPTLYRALQLLSCFRWKTVSCICEHLRSIQRDTNKYVAHVCTFVSSFARHQIDGASK